MLSEEKLSARWMVGSATFTIATSSTTMNCVAPSSTSDSHFMVVLDVAIVNVALPTIQRALSFSSESIQWVSTAYAITFGGLLLLGGRAADLLGRKRMFMIGLVLFS